MKDSAILKEITKNFKRIKLEGISPDKNKYTIIFFHGKNHSSLKYNYTYEVDGKKRKNYFLNKLSSLGNLFLYNRPEEMFRFNYEEGISNCGVDYPNYTIDEHIQNLYKFLAHEKIKPPYILVSHSIGSLYALKFAKKYSKDTKHVFLIDPIQYTKKIAKQYVSNPLSKIEITNHLNIINTPKSGKEMIDKSLSILDSNTYSIPYFEPKLKCHLTTFFNVDTKSDVHQKITLPYVKELQNHNNSRFMNYYFYDRDHYLNETNPQGIITKIKKELKI